MLVSKNFTFSSAHFLSKYYGKCESLHGHNYKLTVTVEGDVQSNGLVVDFVVLKRIVKKHVLDLIDHKLLNDVLDNPSAERLVVWMWRKLIDLPVLLRDEMEDPNIAVEIKKYLSDPNEVNLKDFSDRIHLYEIKLWETETSYVIYRGEKISNCDDIL